MDESFKDWVSIYLICDGIDKVTDQFLESAKNAGIYDENWLWKRAFDVKDSKQNID
mgnify:CR=1 FL=1